MTSVRRRLRTLGSQAGSAALATGLALAIAGPASAATVGPVSNTFVGVSAPSVSQTQARDDATRTAYTNAGLTWNTANCRVTQADVLAYQIHGLPQYQYTVRVTCTGEPLRMPDTLDLVRYLSDGEHLSTTWGAFGYQREGSLGRLYGTQQPGTIALYQCASGARDTFTSPRVDCEGQRYGTRLGYIFQQPPAGVATKRLYRCLIGGEHFDSTDPGCEGQRTEGLLGYTLA
ncbi:hypothetical protein [Actinoplanes sp. NPDC026670]|uniref:hypothetical protein n=1 Tax=Actinoplanes sp. NPDC026670 TaxID=3154700 RepID=UPI0033D0D11A